MTDAWKHRIAFACSLAGGAVVVIHHIAPFLGSYAAVATTIATVLAALATDMGKAAG